jgi:hypothetical protein
MSASPCLAPNPDIGFLTSAGAADSRPDVTAGSVALYCAPFGADSDADGLPDDFDNCPADPNPQFDNDEDGRGDVCDPDDDNDGMSDVFEITYGLDPFDPLDAALDPDADGLDNAREAYLGSDPLTPNADTAVQILPVIIKLLLSE